MGRLYLEQQPLNCEGVMKRLWILFKVFPNDAHELFARHTVRCTSYSLNTVKYIEHESVTKSVFKACIILLAILSQCVSPTEGQQCTRMPSKGWLIKRVLSVCGFFDYFKVQQHLWLAKGLVLANSTNPTNSGSLNPCAPSG